MPTIMYLFGLRFFFYSEEHRPVHVHVQSGDGKAKIDVETGCLIENEGVKPSDLKKALEAVERYKDDIIRAWNEYFDD